MNEQLNELNKKLNWCLNTSTTGLFSHIESMGGTWVDKGNQWCHFAYLDRGAPVLAVAHVDTVQQDRPAPIIETSTVKWKSGKGKKAKYKSRKVNLLKHPRLDDRLGVFIILELLPRLGIEVDILLTDNEEYGQSTAMYLQELGIERQYNWIVEFDRAGEDVVTYGYGFGTDGVAWEQTLMDAGFKVGDGIFSDIGELEWMDAKGFNVGVGYHEYHNRDAWCDTDELNRNLKKFIDFYHRHRDTHFPHAYSKYVSGRRKRYTNNFTYGTSKFTEKNFNYDGTDYVAHKCDVCKCDFWLEEYEPIIPYYVGDVLHCDDCLDDAYNANDDAAEDCYYCGKTTPADDLYLVEPYGDVVCETCVLWVAKKDDVSSYKLDKK